MDTVRCDGDARCDLEDLIDIAFATLDPALQPGRVHLSPGTLAALAARTLRRPSRYPSLAEAEAELRRLSRSELARWLRAAARTRRAHERDHCAACAMASPSANRDRRTRGAAAVTHAELDTLPALEPWMLRAGIAEELACAAADGWPIEPALARVLERVQTRPVCVWASSARLARWAHAMDLRERAARRALRLFA